MARRLPGIRDIYKGIRKPTAPPTRLERDEREKIRGREGRREIEEHGRSRRRKDSGQEE